LNRPSRAVVDTNVLIVANGKSDHASSECVIAAIDFLTHGESDAVIVLDSIGHIFSEYQNHCSFKGQPGTGDRFFLYLHQRQADVSRVQKVDIHPNDQGSYDEVPRILSDFDRSDHKFVATVIADECRSVLVNCADSDWREAAQGLKQCAVEVVELCAGRAQVRGG
jgi:hypothetical protein